MKRILTLMLITIMSLCFVSTVFADELPNGTSGGDKTITITTPSGLDSSATNVYTVYKVFDAQTNGTNISYKAIDHSVPNGFIKDDSDNVYLGTLSDTATGAAGEFVIVVNNVNKYLTPSTSSELTADQINSIKSFVNGKTPVGTITITGSGSKTVTVPDYGYYYITTTTGTVVSINSTNKSVSISDKNTVPTLNKVISNTDKNRTGMAGTIDSDGKKAFAELGKDVEYTATITVGKGEKNYVFHDKMGTGLTFKGNDYVTVTSSPSLSDSWYTIKDTPENDDTLTIQFKDGIPENTVITIKYIGVVNSDALTIETGKNTARVTYGDNNSHNHTPDSFTNVYNAKLSIIKNDSQGSPLTGAGFVIKNSANKYYKYNEGTSSTSATVSWVANIAEATEHFSTSDGTVHAFTGLVDGTYTIVEKTVPNGYNSIADKSFVISANNYENSNLIHSETVVNQKGAVLPTTGGIGTTIFHVAGAALIIGAGLLLVSKKRLEK